MVSIRVSFGVVLTTLVVFALAMCATPQRATAATFSEIYRRVKPSVVYIVAATADGAQSGSGFIYDSNGSRSIIVTADHVVAGAQRIDVILDSDVNKRYHATLLEHDRKRDVAFLEVPVSHRVPLALMERPDIAEGNSIAVIGYPRAAKMFERVEGDDLRPSVHEGIISAVRLGGEIIQFDAQVDHGDSGGPVIDVSTGKVVALVRGDLLDRSYIAAGLEKPLPGSAFGASSPTIYAVRNGLNATAASDGQSGTVPSKSSASYRVAFASPEGSNSVVQGMMDAFTQQIREHFTGTNMFYAIPASPMLYGTDSSKLQAYCDDLRVNALVLPYYNWQSDITLYGSANVTVGLVVSDCYGVPFYAAHKSKSESRFFANRTVEREVNDMGNDLIDRMLADFDAYRESNSEEWEDLLRYGVAANPKSLADRVLVGVVAQDKQYRVKYIRPEGLGAKAGLAEGDIIASIDGAPPNPQDTAWEVAQQLESANAVVVRRPDGDVTVTLRGAHASVAQPPIASVASSPMPSVAVSPSRIADAGSAATPAPLMPGISGTQNMAPVFSPPVGWDASAGGSGFDGMTTLGLWKAPSNTGQTIAVASQPVPDGLTPTEFARLTLQGLENAIGANNVTAFKPVRICNGMQDGWYIQSNVLVGIVHMVAEQTIGLAASQSFVATYRRPDNIAESPAARRALDSLCPSRR